MKQAVSVVLAVLIGVGIAFAVFRFGGFGTPAHERAARRLTSADATVRARAIGKWSRPKGQSKTPALFNDWAVMDALRPRILSAPGEAVRDLGDSFAEFPQWVDQFPVGQEKYIIVLASDPDPGAGAWGLRQIRRFDPDQQLGRIATALDFLVDHADAQVRLAALEHASHYLGSNAEPIVAKRLDDPDETVARTAWLHLAVINPSSGYTARWREAPDRVAYAMLYATAVTNPIEVKAIIAETSRDDALFARMRDVPFLLKYITDGNRPDQFVPGATMDDAVRDLAQDARRARWILAGDSEDLLFIPGDET